MGQRLGQHFLRDGRLADQIIATADVGPGDHVLEVGPGPGVLTGRLAARAGRLTVIELDEELADGIEREHPNVKVVRGDVLKTDLAALGPFDAIVSNLPYQVSGPVTFRFLDLLPSWRRAVLMYQKEFADRLLASPGSKQYGRLTVHAARHVAVARLRDVPPGAFDPPPKVRSTVVILTPHAAPPFEVADEALWRRIVDGAFAQRRKMLHNTLPAATGRSAEEVRAVLDELDIATARPEEIAPEVFAQLTRRLGDA